MCTDISELQTASDEVASIPVPINYDTIRLFSEGLYRSPHKAIEELVSNGYDAGATKVHILLPEQSESQEDELEPLWVIDNGHGMDKEGFYQLWRVADSNKTDAIPNRRAPIGQFGIGKLAAYVIAWKLTHLSYVHGTLRLTTMNFHKVTGLRLHSDSKSPVKVSLREIEETTAKSLVAGIKQRDPNAWTMMFDQKQRVDTWTAVALTDFKDLYNQLSTGRLRWVLSTGLPLHTNFRISLNGEFIRSSKENLEEIKRLSFRKTFPTIGEVKGTARIHKKKLTTGKSQQYGRSNGFFIRVRKRVINLEDELFGLQQPNHAAWSRFALEVDADGLRDHLLSSREGVRNSTEIETFREYLLKTFNKCRSAFDDWHRTQVQDIDIMTLLSDTTSIHVTEPLLLGVRQTLESGSGSFYIDNLPEVQGKDSHEWLATHENEILSEPFLQTKFEHSGPNVPALRYNPATRRLVVNSDHPFVDKLTSSGKNRIPAKLFASSEVLLEGQLQDQGMQQSMVASFLRKRDRTLRLMAGDAPPTSVEVLRQIDVAKQDPTALERAVGSTFRVLGFEYERKGGNSPGVDGLLFARLGRHERGLADYTLVYDAKQSNQPSVQAGKIDLASLETFRKENNANFAFFIAKSYAAQADADGVLNKRISSSKEYAYLTLLTIGHLHRLILLHFNHGLTLSRLRTLFESARTVPEVEKWISNLETELNGQDQVPLNILFDGLEKEKGDPKARPNIHAIRAQISSLRKFEPERLIARLRAVQHIVGDRWIEVAESGNVVMHHTGDQILREFQRQVRNLHSDDDEDFSRMPK